MELVRRRAYARAGLIGNPSDGYNGKTISLIVRNFCAEVVLYEWEDVEIVQTHHERNRFGHVREIVKDVQLHGYGGAVRLLKATIKRFVEYCDQRSLPLHDRPFSIRYETNIPRQVGLAGSSAIIVATLRCLLDYYRITMPKEIQPSFVLSVETEELGIAAGLQDRVIQVYEGLVAMDFSPEKTRRLDGFDVGDYQSLDAKLLPSIYLAYSADRGEPTEVLHNNLRARFLEKDPKVLSAMKKFVSLTDEARRALETGDAERLGRLMDENFDTRRSICKIARMHEEMVETARSAGASAKFAGSGGAIIGTYRDEATWQRLQTAMAGIHCAVLKPQVEPL